MLFSDNCYFCKKKVGKDICSLRLEYQGARCTALCCLECYNKDELKKKGWEQLKGVKNETQRT